MKFNKPYMILKALFKTFPMPFSEFENVFLLKRYMKKYFKNKPKNQVF